VRAVLEPEIDGAALALHRVDEEGFEPADVFHRIETDLQTKQVAIKSE
jgi:predicted cobalt transporter CbtA